MTIVNIVSKLPKLFAVSMKVFCRKHICVKMILDMNHSALDLAVHLERNLTKNVQVIKFLLFVIIYKTKPVSVIVRYIWISCITREGFLVITRKYFIVIARL